MKSCSGKLGRRAIMPLLVAVLACGLLRMPVILKSGVKFGAFIRICPKTTHSQAKFMQQLIKVSRSRLQSSSGFNL